MKPGIRIISCIMMMAIALTMAVFTLADFRAPDEGGYLLREHEGLVAVYPSGGGKPIAVTDIELGSLRRADREKIQAGLPAFSEKELQQLLEDLGS